jgi:ABC-type antimicrobial peptide transport system permease subunit
LSDGGPWALPFLLFVLIGAGISASWVPLRRALAVDPSEALRAE